MIRGLLLFLIGLAASPALAQQSHTITTSTTVKVVKPLQLTVLRNMDFGTITLGTLTSSQTIGLSAAGRSCGNGTQVTCSGAFATAQIQVVGTNNQQVMIRSATPTITLSNAVGATLTLTPVLPPSVTMPNSGNQGVTLEIGGNLVIPPSASEGLYSGTIDIQFAYQ